MFSKIQCQAVPSPQFPFQQFFRGARFGFTARVAAYFSLIAIGGGLGMALAYFYERKNPPGKDEEA